MELYMELYNPDKQERLKKNNDAYRLNEDANNE